MNAVCVSMVDKVGAQLKFLRELTLQLLHFFFPSLLVRERERVSDEYNCSVVKYDSCVCFKKKVAAKQDELPVFVPFPCP